MPIYMDIHEVPGIEAYDAAAAHRQDMQIQKDFQCSCMTYWIDLTREVVFCLIEAPDKSDVEAMHRQSHGLIPHRIIEVQNEVVQSFLGRIQDPEDVKISEDGLKVFTDTAFRILLVADRMDPVLLSHSVGQEKAHDLLNRLNDIIRKELMIHEGREVEHRGNEFIISFSSASKALGCALEIQDKLPLADRKLLKFKVALSAGEPVAKSDKIFGDVIRMAKNLCSLANGDRIIISSEVQKLLANERQHKDKNFIALSRPDEQLLDALLGKLEENWQETNFGAAQFCQALTMSKSQLYRKTMALWGLSPNLLLKDFRLHKAMELLRSQGFNISQTTFDSGFTSPSYFTKCFKKKFGLLPAAYLNGYQNL